jgi:hypothetical protein
MERQQRERQRIATGDWRLVEWQRGERQRLAISEWRLVKRQQEANMKWRLATGGTAARRTAAISD